MPTRQRQHGRADETGTEAGRHGPPPYLFRFQPRPILGAVGRRERFAEAVAFETHAVSPVHAEVTERLHELCVAGTEAYRLGLVGEKELPAAPWDNARPDGQAPQAPFPPRLVMARYSCSSVSGGVGSGWARSLRKPSSRR